MSDPTQQRPVGRRWPEIAVALLLAALGVVVIADSVRVGIGWAEDGPRSGYFPFYIGLLLLASSIAVLVAQWRGRHADDEPFADREQLQRVGSVLLPMAVFVALLEPLGLYVASAALIGWFMRRHGKHRIGTTLAIAIGVPLVIFLVFERWFLVPLPKGPVEAMLGF